MNNVEGIWNVFSGENHINCPGCIVLSSLQTNNNVGLDEKYKYFYKNFRVGAKNWGR